MSRIGVRESGRVCRRCLSAVVLGAALLGSSLTPGTARATGVSESGATALAIGTTAAGFAVLITPYGSNRYWPRLRYGVGLPLIFAGPSTAHFLCDEVAHGLGFTGLRVLSGAVFMVGTVMAQIGRQIGSGPAYPGGLVVATTGFVAYWSLAIYDIYDAHRIAWHTPGHAIWVTPLASGDAGGLALAGRW